MSTKKVRKPRASKDSGTHPPQLPNICRKRRADGSPINSKNFKSQDLSSLYILLKQFGTSEAALEFISACGLNKKLDEIREKVIDIRELANEAKTIQIEQLKKKYEEEEKEPPTEKSMHNHIFNNWSAPILASTSNIRGCNHACLTTVFIEGLNALPKDKMENVLISHSPMVKNKEVKMDVDFGKIQKFLGSLVSSASPLFYLNSIESAIVLKMMDELWEEAQAAIGDREKAILRGFLKRFKDKSNKEYSFTHPECPCEELSSTMIHLDPIRTRNWNILKDVREITLDDVDVNRVRPDFERFEQIEEPEEGIPIVQIDPSEVNSMRYPPGPLVGSHALKPIDNDREEKVMDNLRFL